MNSAFDEHQMAGSSHMSMEEYCIMILPIHRLDLYSTLCCATAISRASSNICQVREKE